MEPWGRMGEQGVEDPGLRDFRPLGLLGRPTPQRRSPFPANVHGAEVGTHPLHDFCACLPDLPQLSSGRAVGSGPLFEC